MNNLVTVWKSRILSFFCTGLLRKNKLLNICFWPLVFNLEFIDYDSWEVIGLLISCAADCGVDTEVLF